MKRYLFTARLLDDAVISERSATTGGHRSLDHIPGACFLGAAASRLYGGDGIDSFTLFHSGAVRFGNAYPLDDQGGATLPVPLSWHAPKGEELNRSVAEVANLVQASDADFALWEKSGTQQKQLRSGYFSLAGSYCTVSPRYRLKTAIGRKKFGMAEDAQMFGYQALPAGSNWWFSLEADAAVPQHQVDALLTALTGTVRIGRSRSAEYGGLEIKRCAAAFAPKCYEDAQQLVLYCSSDLALSDPATGVPLLVPEGAVLGLGDAQLDAARSYLRVRSYAPFNATRQRYDLERQVIAKGSVLVFRKDGGFGAGELDALHVRFSRGIGQHRPDGLGRILINPVFLQKARFTRAEEAPLLAETAAPAPTDPSLLQNWLVAKAKEQTQARETVARIDGWIAELVRKPESCPKNSQWGQVRNYALREVSVEGMRERLEKLCSDGVSQKQWERKFVLNGEKVSFADFLQKIVLPKGIDLAEARQSLYLMGSRLPRKINQSGGGR
jgi:CRISPR-associated protein Csx10